MWSSDEILLSLLPITQARGLERSDESFAYHRGSPTNLC